MRTSQGIALATWSPDGRAMQTYVINVDRDGRVPIPRTPLSVYRLRGELQRLPLSEGWTDSAAAMQSGHFLVRAAPGADLTMYVGDDAPLAAKIVESSGNARINIEPWSDDERRTHSTFSQDSAVVKISVTVPPSEAGPALITFALGGVPRHALSRLSFSGLAAGGPSALYRVNTDELLRAVDSVTEVLGMSRDEQSALIGAGWSAVDFDGVTTYRWMTSGAAQVLLPVHAAQPSRITVQAFNEGSAAAANRTMALRLNGVDLPAQALQSGWASYEWNPPAGLLRAGVNELAFHVSPASAAEQPARRVAVTSVAVSSRPVESER